MPDTQHAQNALPHTKFFGLQQLTLGFGMQIHGFQIWDQSHYKIHRVKNLNSQHNPIGRSQQLSRNGKEVHCEYTLYTDIIGTGLEYG